MSLLDHFKPWKLVAEMEFSQQWRGGLLNRDHSWTEDYTVAFYEKGPKIRKVKLIGDQDHRIKELVERLVYKWRDHEGELPFEAKRIE